MSELKILICDDNPDLQGLLVRRLDKMGLKPDVAGDGRQALGLVDKHNYDVIVTDIYMPEASGLEVLQHAKQLDQDTQVVIITSSATLDNAIDALNHGAFGYLTKPFDHLIVFDKMVSRALDYRHLLVAEKRKTEAQKRRGDMLEDEVAQRVQQLQKKQKGLLALLGSLPDGILVVEEGGKVVLSSPMGERWLARDEKLDDRPIHNFIAQVHAEMAEPSLQIRVGEQEVQLMAADFPDEGEVKRKAVIVREVEERGVGAGSLVTDTVMGIKKGLATLYEQGLGTEIVLSLANQFAMLEQLAGWTGGTGGLKPVSNAPAVPAPEPAAKAETEQPPAQPVESPPPAPAQSAAEDPHPSPTPPFMVPRPRVATADLDEPRMNTAELQDALRVVGEPAEAADRPETDAAAQSDPESFEAEAGFPTAQPTGDLDSSVFRPRLIPEELDAALEPPTGLPNANGKRGLLARAKGPVKIQSPQADTQLFRRVLAGMSGSEVEGVSGDKEGPPKIKAAQAAKSERPRAKPAQEKAQPESEDVLEGTPEPEPPPDPEPHPEPRPAPSKAEGASWPPKRPSEDPQWDDGLDTSD